MAPKCFFLLLCCAIFILAGAQQINAQTYKTGHLSRDVQLREKLFHERKTLEQKSPKYDESNISSLEKIQVSDEQIVYITAVRLNLHR